VHDIGKTGIRQGIFHFQPPFSVMVFPLISARTDGGISRVRDNGPRLGVAHDLSFIT
jgi:hypothetical protein